MAGLAEHTPPHSPVHTRGFTKGPEEVEPQHLGLRSPSLDAAGLTEKGL